MDLGYAEKEEKV